MSEIESFRAFYRWNSTVRRKYLEAILSLPPEERLRDRGASFPSLQEIYVHVLDALNSWIVLVPQDRYQGTEDLPGRTMTPDELRTATTRIDRDALAYVMSLRGADLDREIVCHYPGDHGPVVRRFPTRDVLWHMVEEELQHRGEMNALFWQMDIDPPLGTYPEWTDALAGARSD